MRSFLAGLLVSLALTCSAQAQVPVASEASVRMVHYVYTVTWEGATGLLPASGTMDVLFQDDRKADQQQVFVVRTDGTLVGHAISAEGVTFLSRAGQQQDALNDFALGIGLTGEYLTIKNILDWAQGKDAQTNADRATISKGKDGQVRTLDEDGWHIVYSGGTTTSSGVGTIVPKQWVLTRVGSPLKINFALREARAFDENNLPKDYKPITVM